MLLTLQVFELKGFAPLEETYLKTWLHSGQRVMAEDPEIAASSSIGKSVHTARVSSGGEDPTSYHMTIQGLSPQGFLLAKDDRGRLFELTPDGNSLDMMKGLIKRKIA